MEMTNAVCWKGLWVSLSVDLHISCTSFIRVMEHTEHISAVSTNPEFPEEVIFFLFLIPPSLQLFIKLVLIE